MSSSRQPDTTEATIGRFNIFAWNVNTGGAAVLLDRLAAKARESYPEVVVYADPKNPSPYLRSIGARYVSNRLAALQLGEPEAVNLYFGNIPPLKRTLNSILYVHSPYVVKGICDLVNEPLGFRFKLKHALLALYLRAFHRNVERVFCQTESMQKSLAENHDITAELVPFYPPIDVDRVRLKAFDLCYVGLPSVHKNHGFLLDVMEHIAARFGTAIRLALTVPDIVENQDLLARISRLNDSTPLEIVNKGLVRHDLALDIFRQSHALVFPSKLETYGLPLVEAALLGLPVFCPSLPYSNDVLDGYVPIELDKVDETAERIQHFVANKQDYRAPRLRAPDMIDVLLDPARHPPVHAGEVV